MMQVQPIVKRSILTFLAFTLIHVYGSAQNTGTPYRMKTIVIDAGHGGNDPGNLGTGRYKAKEKDIALEVALMVGGYIEKQFPEIKVRYTRSTDVFIGLGDRADIANKAKADLFLSIHCNAATNTSANGVETFTLGLHKNQENLEVARKENSAIFLEDDYKTKYEGFDPNSAESIIALTIMQSAYLQQSLTISSYIQQQFKERVGRRDRGVKQAGFLVLRKTTMPSILIELGFLTNAAEEDFLNTENGKSFMASAIFRGFKEYKELVEDPLPEGQSIPEKKAETVAEEKPKTVVDKPKVDVVQKAEDQAKLKAVADSLEQAKQKLLDEKKKREEDLEQQIKEKQKAALKAKVDSLETLRLAKIAAFELKQKELADKKAKELAEKEAKEAAAKKAEAEKVRKELEAKEEAKKWLEEIKDVKQQELEDAKRQAATDEEKARLEAIKKQKEEELAEAKRIAAEKGIKEQSDSLVARRLILEQARIDSLAKARNAAEAKDASIAKEKQDAELAKAQEKQKQDLIAAEKAKAEAARKEALRKEEEFAAKKREALNKARQDSIATARKNESEAIEIKDAATAEEAELLFLQLRKKQLEQRIAKLKGQNVETVTKEKLEERASKIPDPIDKVSEKTVPGLVLKVQVITSNSPLSKGDAQFKGKDVWQYEQGGLYKYTIGSTQDFEEITKLQGELRNQGFAGAFVVAFKDGERIKVSEARDMLNKKE